MDDVRESLDDLLEDRPALESELESVLAVDQRRERWSFDDVPLDSGTFGELVSRDVVTKRDDDSYELADPALVRSVVDDDFQFDESDAQSRSVLPDLGFDDVDVPLLLAVVGALALVVGLRTMLTYGAVFRDGQVVLAGNDPYAARYLVETLQTSGLAPFDPTAFGALPESSRTHDVLFHLSVWWFAALLGGGAHAAGLALAWYPVLSAAATAVAIYLVATRLAGDRRIGLASMVLLGVTPAHVFRTALGFGDHHAFDFLLLSFSLLGVVTLAKRSGRRPATDAVRSSPLVVAGLALALAAQILAWRGGPIFLIPLGAFVAARGISDVRAGESPFDSNAPILTAVAAGAVLTLFAHYGLGWIRTYQAFALPVLLVGLVAVVAVAEFAHRSDVEPWALLAGEAVAGTATIGLFAVVFPWFSAAIDRLVSYLTATNETGIAETASLFGGDVGSIAGPILLFGFVFYLAIPYVGWATLASVRSHRPAWLAAVTYCWAFVLLSVVQVRFTGSLAVVVAPFAGLGFVHVAEKVDITGPVRPFDSDEGGRPRDDSTATAWRPTRPSRQTVLSLTFLFLLVGGVSLVQAAVKTDQITIEGEAYQTATWIEEYAADQDLTYPENYVFSTWGRNRMYNYLVSGESRSYGYARGYYEEFATSMNPAGMYRIHRDRVGFVVTTDDVTGLPADSLHVRLQDRLGSGTESVDGLSHYRAVYQSPEGGQSVFTLVPGATITGEAPANETVRIRTNVSVESREVTYERYVETTMDGRYAVTVPHPGTYRGGNGTVEVAEADVQNGGFALPRDSRAHWQFGEGRGDVAFDARGNNHGRIHGGTWTDGVDGRALRLDGDDYVEVTEAGALNGSDAFTLTTWFRTDPDVDYRENVTFPRLVSKSPIDAADGSGYHLALSNGRLVGTVRDEGEGRTLLGPRVDDGDWHQAVLVYNGTHVELYADGERVGLREFRGDPASGSPLVVGASPETRRPFVGSIDEVTYTDEPLDGGEVADRYNETRPS